MSAPTRTREAPAGDPAGTPREGARAEGPAAAAAAATGAARVGTERREQDAGAGARARTGMAAAVGALLRKELLVEVRTLESVPGMSLFAVSTFVVFHFALNRGSVTGQLAAGILWVTLLLAAMLGINRLFVADAEQGGFDGFLLAPVDGTALLVAKAGALAIYLVALELVAVPAFALLLLGSSLWQAMPALLGVLALADLGVALIGTLVAALAVRTRARDLLGPLMALPLLVPVVIGAARASAPLLQLGHAGAVGARWWATLALYDFVFALIAYALFDFLLED